MDDRIAEIRKALRWWDRMKDSTKWRPAIPVAFGAAQELVDLLDSDALIIRRDENGKWPTWICDIMESHYDPRRAFDALASSQEVEPPLKDYPHGFGMPIGGVEP